MDTATCQTRLHRVMTQHVVDALFNGRDEVLPKVTEHGKPQRVSEWLSSCDDKQEQLLFKLVHLALHRDNPQALYAVADELAAYVGADYADAYVAFNEG